ncbi:MAG: hypothetical protein D6715_04210 [Calditrichaeota bacterium]|nr:MAG: hypothetical protein D6715_04210 [Calditrichota bacterium]
MTASSLDWKRHPVVSELLALAPEMPLDAGRPVAAVEARLSALAAEDLFAPQPVSDPAMARCCLAGLWLRFNFLDQSHRISQGIPTPSGSYWHGMLHRREGDYWNSKYWMRRVGTHPVFQPLTLEARQLCETLGSDPHSEYLRRQTRWDPFKFVDLVASCVSGTCQSVSLVQQIQAREWELLFDYCYRHAYRR